MRLPPFNPKLAIAIGVAAVSLTAVLVKLADQAPASIIANYRLLIAAIALIPFVLLHHRKDMKQLKPSSWALLAACGVLLAIHLSLFFESLHHTSVASAASLVVLQPIAVLLLGLFMSREKFSQGAAISITIAFIGILIILIGDYMMGGSNFYGDVLALASMVILAVYYTLGQRVRMYLNLLSYTFFVYVFGGIILLLFNLGFSNSFTGFDTSAWLSIIILALVPTFLGYSLFNWALKWIQAQTVQTGMIFEPVVAVILAFFILHEHVTGTQLLGGAVILFGLFLFIMSTARKPKVTISKK